MNFKGILVRGGSSAEAPGRAGEQAGPEEEEERDSLSETDRRRERRRRHRIGTNERVQGL